MEIQEWTHNTRTGKLMSWRHCQSFTMVWPLGSMLKAHHSPAGPCCPSLWRLVNINATGKEKWMSWEGSRSLLFSGSCSLVLVASYFQVVGWWHKIQTSFPQFNHAMMWFDICKSTLLIMKSMWYYDFYTKNVIHFPFYQLIFISKCKFLFSLS